jgi:hypothetical protein
MAQLKSTVVQGALTVTGNMLASKIIKLGGAANQILMADGSTMNADEVGTGTVTSVGVTSTSLTVTGSPITGAGTITIEHPTTTATAADIYKIGKDDKGHVVIGDKIVPADLGLSTVYKYKGTKTWAELKALASAEIGDVYSITDKDPDGNTNADWACYTTVTAATGDSYANYWQSLGGKVDLSSYITGSGTANYIPKFTAAGAIGNSEIIDNGSNVYPNANLGNALGHADYIWDKLYVRQIDLNRAKGPTYGRINFYSPAFYTWYEYMSNNGVASPTSKNTPQYGEVTSWARRSLIEDSSGYGWIWEACKNSNTVAPVGKMALSSNTGNLTVAGSVTANGFKHSDATTGTNDYVLLAGGSTKPISEFTTGGGSISDYVTKSTDQTITGIKTFSHSTFGAIILKRNGSTNAASIAFQNNNGTLGYIGMTNAANGGLQRWTANTNTVYTVWDSGNDGSGSGLDADKLDGQEGSYYLNYNNFTNKPTIPNPADYYWANIKVSSTSSTATTPSVQKMGITGSTAIDAAAAVTMEYDSSYKALKFVFA